MKQDSQAPSPPPQPPPQSRNRVRTFASLAHRDYRFLFAGNLFNNMALWLQLISLSWLTWELTKDPATGQGSALLSGTAGGLRALPTLVIGPWAGVLADRFDRRKLLTWSQLFMACTALGFAVLVVEGEVEVWHVFLYAAVTAISTAIIQPARMSLVANTVPRQDLGNAMALFAMTVTSMRLAGAFIGGMLIRYAGVEWAFFLEGGCYAAMGLLLIPMRTPYYEKPTTRGTGALANLKDGIRYIWTENRIILHLMVLTLILAFVFLPLAPLLPAYAAGVLGADANVNGFLMGSMGVGGLLTTFVIASFAFPFGTGRSGLVALVLGSAMILVMAQSDWLMLSLVVIAVMGCCQTIFIVGNITLIQGMVPDTLRGRVSSIWSLQNALNPLAILLTGLFIDLYTARGAFTIISATSVGISLIFLVAFKQVRDLK